MSAGDEEGKEMRKALALSVIILAFVPCRPPETDRGHAVTGATPIVPEAADVRTCSEGPPDENGSVWPEGPAEGEGAGVVLMAETSGPTGYIVAYTDKKSYLPGETINFRISTTAATCSIEILKEQWERKLVAKVTGVAGAYHPMPGYSQKPWEEGASWPVSYSWVVPEEWENGSYLALLRTTSGPYAFTYHPFIVRTRLPGSHSKIAFVMNYNTRNAYNYWGGKSLYYSGVPGDKHYAVGVSFLRPLGDSSGRGVNYWGQYELTSQLIADGYAPEYITEWDISSDPVVLRAYDVVVLAGHHEYVCRNMYDALEAHHRRGGHLAFFSGNDIYWQVRFEDGGNKMVSYKGYAMAEDPVRGIDNSLLTTLWGHELVGRPAETLQGIVYVPYSYCFLAEEYVVQDCNHFVFEETGLRNGDVAGSKVAAGETDYLGPASPGRMDILLRARRSMVLAQYASYVQVGYVDAAAVYYEDSEKYGFTNGRGGQV